MEWFVACPRGFEALLAAELEQLGATATRLTVAGGYARGDLAFAYSACLWPRLANRMLLPVTNFTVPDAKDLYTGVRQVDWSVVSQFEIFPCRPIKMSKTID